MKLIHEARRAAAPTYLSKDDVDGWHFVGPVNVSFCDCPTRVFEEFEEDIVQMLRNVGQGQLSRALDDDLWAVSILHLTDALGVLDCVLADDRGLTFFLNAVPDGTFLLIC